MRSIAVAALVALVTVSVHSGVASAAPEAADPAASALAEGLGISQDAARERLRQQDRAHEVLAALPPVVDPAGTWFDEGSGSLTVAVTDQTAAAAARAHGARAVLVPRSAGALAELRNRVRALATPDVAFNTIGIDQRANEVLVTVNRTRMTAATRQFVAAVSSISGVRVEQSDTGPRQQAGEVRPGDPWWPQGEGACSVGFAATDANGGKHFLTAGHCTNNANQPAYGQSGNQNRVGTSNVGGSRSVNGREGDMGVVAVTEPGWTLSASVNTWGSAAVTVTGAAETIVGDSVCHSGNGSKWRCGTVTYVNETVDYGGGTVVDGLTFTTACSLGGDSGGAWLRGDKAVGLHSGGPAQCVPNPAKDEQSVFQPVSEALRKWNLTLFTGGGGGGDTQPPSTPAGLRSTAQTATSLSLAWNAATDNVGVTGYDVYLGATLAASTATTSATVSGLTPDTAYSVTVRARDAAGNASPPGAALAVRTKPGSGGGRAFGNDTDQPIADQRTAASRISSTATGAAANPVRVSVTARHTCQEDLRLRVVSPAGWWYQLKNSGGSACTPFPGTATHSFSPFAEQASGTWTLEVTDTRTGNTGVLDSWSITV
ncbi:Chitinase [Actinokineospora spheciospongiae]|uniref:Chitinase n=1 Tax=Actinokineospora spheciospongiae TaxID=909613 RepID=W7IHH9_9PSEU|nr:proprotein convertase P-domain-containing protein [Actinokineospora spheciospongiae]EWC59768.1 Chitinase [Actinokineospora spheciospongiae]